MENTTLRVAPLIVEALEKAQSLPHKINIKVNETENLFGDVESSGAIFSSEEDPLYRYMLWRSWSPDLPVLVAVMLNPSTADHSTDDRTIETLIARAKATGHGSILVINLFAWRDTSPAEMKKAEDPIGPANDEIIDIILEQEGYTFLCAWGAHGCHMDRSEKVLCKIIKRGKTPVALKISKTGEPEHPLYKKLSESWFPLLRSGATN